MSKLAMIAKFPGVKSSVLSDAAGGFLDAAGDVDGETVAAVAGVLTTMMGEAGEQLGLGALRRMSFTGRARACLVAVQSDAVVTAFVEPSTSIGAVEKALDATGEA
jgi:predicted regulator of Ras-like GTPase activity (Roadblock/LC7/MglB family)